MTSLLNTIRVATRASARFEHLSIFYCAGFYCSDEGRNKSSDSSPRQCPLLFSPPTARVSAAAAAAALPALVRSPSPILLYIVYKVFDEMQEGSWGRDLPAEVVALPSLFLCRA